MILIVVLLGMGILFLLAIRDNGANVAANTRTRATDIDYEEDKEEDSYIVRFRYQRGACRKLGKQLYQQCEVAGISRTENRDDADSFVYANRKALRLEREPDNPRDPKAIQVLGVSATSSYTLGYIPKAIASELAPLMDAGHDIRARLDTIFLPTDRYSAKVFFSIWDGSAVKKTKKTEPKS